MPLVPAAKLVVENLRQDTGIPKTEALTRILEWFAGLDLKFRLAVLNKNEAARRELASESLARMAGIDKAKMLDATADMTPDQLAQAIRFLTDRLHDACTGYQRTAERLLKKDKGK